MRCQICGHLLTLHRLTPDGVCSALKCKCRVPGITPAQAKVLQNDS